MVAERERLSFHPAATERKPHPSLLRLFNAAFYRIWTGTKIRAQTGRASGDKNFAHICTRAAAVNLSRRPFGARFSHFCGRRHPRRIQTKQESQFTRFFRAEARKRNQSAAVPSIFQLHGDFLLLAERPLMKQIRRNGLKCV
jgi:hypothetical protein